jgi:hypothetical protein
LVSNKQVHLQLSQNGCENISPSDENSMDTIQEKPTLSSEDIFWKRIFVVFCIILLCLTAGQLLSMMYLPFTGTDYRVFKSAVQVLDQGEDPYFLLNINYYSGEMNPFNYPPHTLFFFWCLQYFFVFQSLWTYYTFLIVFLIMSGYIILTMDQKPQYLFFITLLLTSFISIYWNFVSGNKDILFLFLFAVILYLMVREKFWQSSIVMGLMGSFSLITIPFTVLYLVVRRPIFDRAKYILLSIGVIVVIFLITWWVTPSLLISYMGNIEGRSSPLNDQSGLLTPTPFLMFGYFLNHTNTSITIPLVCVSLVYIGLIMGASWLVTRKHQDKPLIVYSFVILAIFMMLPRIKPYDFIILIPSFYFLFKDYGNKIKTLVFVVVSLLPISVWYYFWFDRSQPMSFLNYLIKSYTQTLSLFLIFIIAFALIYYKPLPLLDVHS